MNYSIFLSKMVFDGVLFDFKLIPFFYPNLKMVFRWDYIYIYILENIHLNLLIKFDLDLDSWKHFRNCWKVFSFLFYINRWTGLFAQRLTIRYMSINSIFLFHKLNWFLVEVWIVILIILIHFMFIIIKYIFHLFNFQNLIGFLVEVWIIMLIIMIQYMVVIGWI